MSRKITKVLCFLLINILITNTLTFANVDISHNFNEDNKLLDNSMFIGNCTNNEISCVKILTKYDGFHELVDELKEWKKKVEDDVEIAFWLPLLRKIGAVAGGLVSFYFQPLNTLKATTSLVAFCHAKRDVLEPTGKTAKGIFGFFSDTIPGWFGAKKVRDPDNGLIGDFTKFLCGDGKENGQYVTITKEQKEKFMDDILKEFKSKIKEKKYRKNEIIILSLDLKNLQYGLDFGVVGFNPHYDKPVDEYFKPRHFWNEL